MGRRILQVSIEFLVELLKAHDGAQRSYTVEHPLPDDVRVVEVLPYSTRMVIAELESAAWHGISTSPADLEQPQPTVHIEPRVQCVGCGKSFSVAEAQEHRERVIMLTPGVEVDPGCGGQRSET